MIVFSAPQLVPTANPFWAYVNSNFSAALFGALLGAISAAIIASRSERRRRLLGEIVGVNSSIGLAFSIANTFAGTKRQHILEMLYSYQQSFEDYARTFATIPDQAVEHRVPMDFRYLDMPFVVVSELRTNLLERVPSASAALSIMGALSGCSHSMENTLALRARLIVEIAAIVDEDERAAAYFGLRKSNRNLDERYPDHLTAMSYYVDDLIYFPLLLCDVLAAHGAQLATQYCWRAPKITKISYQRIIDMGLMPDPTKHPDFERQFRSPKPLPQKRPFGWLINRR